MSLLNSTLPTFDLKQIAISAFDQGQVKLTCPKQVDDIAIFFESPIAGLNKCRIDVLMNQKQEDIAVGLIGLLSDRGTGSITNLLKIKLCSKNNGEIKFPSELSVVRNYNEPQQMCTSSGDPHVKPFGSANTYNNYASGPTWLVKSSVFDVQAEQKPCNGDKTCNTAVAIRFLDNVYVADLAHPIFACHSANKCATDYGTTIQHSQDGSSILTLPGNIIVSTSRVSAVGMNVIIQAPGQAVSKFESAGCSPAAPITADVRTPIFVVSSSASYFRADAINTPKWVGPVPAGFTECKLPNSCDDVFPPAPKPSPVPSPSASPTKPSPSATPAVSPTAVNPSPSPSNPSPSTTPAVSPTAVNPSPSPSKPSPSATPAVSPSVPSPITTPTPPTKLPPYNPGHKVCNGYTLTKPTVYVPRDPKAIYVPILAQNMTNPPKPDEAVKKCGQVCIEADFKAIGLDLEFEFIIKGCVTDYAPTMFNNVSLALENTRRHCMMRLEQKTTDVIKTSPDTALVKTCTKIQVANSLGDAPCQCGDNGYCTAFGCECKVGYSGKDCSTPIALPATVLPYAQKAQAELPTTGDYHYVNTGTTDANTVPADTAATTTLPTTGTPADTFSSGSAIDAFITLTMVHFLQ